MALPDSPNTTLRLHDSQGMALPDSPSAIDKSNQYHGKNQSYSEKLDLTNMALPDSKALPNSSQVKPAVPDSGLGISESI